jgi:predicted ribosome quality control (RQC) complex YloA/Tae2 family protein
MASKGKPYRTREVDGFQILIGKSDRENDELTFSVAAPGDWWLHAAGASGSHVVIRNPDNLAEPPPLVLKRAAEAAAWYSQARGGGRVTVHFCRARDVEKPPRFPPGKVLLRRWKSIRVTPRGPE